MTTLPVTVQERVQVPFQPYLERSGGSGGGFSASDMLGVLKQRIFLILFIWILVTLGTAGLTYYLVKNRPLFRAHSAVLVESPVPRAPLQLQDQQVAVDIMDRFVADQIQAIKNEDILRDALLSSSVQETAWFRSVREDERSLLFEELRKELSVTQVPGTSYILVAFATKEPTDAPVVVNAIVEKYLDRMRSAYKQQYSTELDEHRKEENRIRDLLEGVKKRKQEFVLSEMGAPGLASGINVVGEQWKRQADAATQAELEKLVLKSQWDSLNNADPSQVSLSPQMQLLIQQDPLVAALNTRLFGLQQQRMIYMQKFGANHRLIQSLDNEIGVCNQQLEDVLTRKEQEVREFQLSQAQLQYLTAAQVETQLRERALELEYKQRDLDGGLTKLKTLEDEQFMLEEQYKQVRGYINQLLLVMSDPTSQVRVRRMLQASVPTSRHFPRWEYNMPAGAVLGLLLGLGLAFLLEIVDMTIKTSRDIVRHAHVAILGTVPDVDDEEVPIDQVETAMHSNPRSMTAEAFRAIRTNLLLSSPAERQRSIVVTSSRPEEGKTTVAVNLAIALAQSGRRVLLVDGNLHRPRLQELFPKARKEGLSNILVGRGELNDLVTATDLPNLSVLSSGPLPPNPTELLAGSYFQDMIAKASDRFDQIIFDGPPVLLMSDALVMAGVVDGVILVCRARQTSRGIVLRAREQLEQVNGRVFGAVLNAAQVRRGGYFREQIRSYYDYQAEEAGRVTDSGRWLPKGEDEGKA